MRREEGFVEVGRAERQGSVVSLTGSSLVALAEQSLADLAKDCFTVTRDKNDPVVDTVYVSG